MTTREELIREHVIHEFDRALAVRNITGCYGALCAQFYRHLLGHVKGRRVLDVGCGLGLFGSTAAQQGFQVHSIDIDERSLEIARELFGPAYHQESAYATSLPDGAIDTVVLNDAVCHLDLDPLVQELDRLGAARVIIHESNLGNALLTRYRKATGHQEHRDYLAEELAEQLGRRGFRQQHCSYCNVLALPLSGGLQRKPAPLIGRFPRFIGGLDWLACGLAHAVGLQRRLAFRFVLIVDRIAQEETVAGAAAKGGHNEFAT